MVTGQDQDVLNGAVLDVGEQPRVLAHRISCALEPVLHRRRLRCGQHLNEAVTTKAHTRAHVVGAGKVAVQRHGVELRQHVDLGDAAVDAVALQGQRGGERGIQDSEQNQPSVVAGKPHRAPDGKANHSDAPANMSTST
eukprot:359014-Chlamydomonas_euryale.AAC.2